MAEGEGPDEWVFRSRRPIESIRCATHEVDVLVRDRHEARIFVKGAFRPGPVVLDVRLAE